MTAGALASAVLFTTPSFAASAPGSAATSVSVRAATDDPPYDQMDEAELRSAIAQKTALPYAGKRVKQEGSALLDSGTVEEMRAWLETGYGIAQAEDDRVALFRILATPGTSDATRQTISDLLDEGSPEAIRAYLASVQ